MNTPTPAGTPSPPTKEEEEPEPAYEEDIPADDPNGSPVSEDPEKGNVPVTEPEQPDHPVS